ncbi:MAG: Ca2+-dependent phosphoinositide-specific phospholipase C [Segetibacter sp.]
MDETGDKIATYIKGHPSLQGRILFTNSEQHTPEAAVMVPNNAKTDSIQSMVKKGFIVRTPVQMLILRKPATMINQLLKQHANQARSDYNNRLLPKKYAFQF